MSRHKVSMLGALIAAALAAAPAAALEKVVLGTNWLPQAEFGGFYQAVADGTYEACGLDVEIRPGGPQVNNRILLPAGKVDFYIGGNMLPALSAVEQDIPTVVVAAIFQKDPQILMTHPGQGLDDWEDLKSIPLLISNTGYQSFYQWMIDAHGFSPDQRRPYTFNSAPFLADERVGQQGYVTSEPFAIRETGGFAPNVFLLADHGFDTYSSTIETRRELVEERPELVRCFVDASIQGWYAYLYGDNAAANARIKAANPDITDEQIAFSIAQMKEYGIVDSGDAETLGIGAMTDARHRSFYEQMVEAGLVRPDIDVAEAYTLEFVNKGVGLEAKAATRERATR